MADLRKLVAALREAGCPDGQILDAVLKLDDERRAKARDGNKWRQVRFRQNHPVDSNARNGVTVRDGPLQAVTDRDERYDASAPRARVLCGEELVITPLDPSGLPPTASKPRRAKRRSALQTGEVFTSEAEEIAVRFGLDNRTAATEWERFVDYHVGKGNLMADWMAAWRTWLRNGKSFAARAGPRDASAGLHNALDFLAEVANGERTISGKSNRDNRQLLPFDGGEGPTGLHAGGPTGARNGA
jgi:hypothetical protein